MLPTHVPQKSLSNNRLTVVEHCTRDLIWFLHMIPSERCSQGVQRALDTLSASVQDVRIDHRRLDVLVAQKLLYRADVVPVLKEVGCERMAKRVGRGAFHDSRLLDGRFDGLLTD